MAITQTTLTTAVARLQVDMPTLAAQLNAADAQLGDGDTGAMLQRLIGVFAQVDIAGARDLGAAFMALAKAGAATTGSSLGALIITALMTAGKQTRGAQHAQWAQVSLILGDVRDALMARGKTELGAKTIIDGIDALAHGLSGVETAEAAAAAARTAMAEAMDAFRERPCTIGRARVMRRPGAASLAKVSAFGRRPAPSHSPFGGGRTPCPRRSKNAGLWA